MTDPGSLDELLEGEHRDSPLWMVSRAPALNELVTQLREVRRALETRSSLRISVSRSQVEQARADFSAMIRQGEQALHQLATLLAETLLTEYRLSSVVIGEVEASGERFTLALDTTPEELYSRTDIDEGNRVLSRLRIQVPQGWSGAKLVSNVVEYEALIPNPLGVSRVLTRIKAEEEIWNKVADELYEIDSLVLKDKELRHLSRYVKDVFGIKLVATDAEQARKLQQHLAGLRFDDDALRAEEVVPDDAHRMLRFVEVKDYLRRQSRKRSGWTALKSVILWGDRTFEIQVQPLENFLRERERLTRESHAGFKQTREQVRDEIALRTPSFTALRELLRWLFLHPDEPPPRHPGVDIEVRH